jgi:chromosome segregation ATPase
LAVLSALSHSCSFPFCSHSCRQALADKKKEFVEMEKRAVQIQHDYAEIRQKVAKKKEEAEKVAPLQDENGEELPLKAQLSELEVETLHEVEAALEEAEQKANSIDANPDVMRQYAERKTEIEEIQTRLDDLTSSKDSKLSQIETKRKPWETALSNNIAKINVLFTKYMSEMGCTGEVGLIKGESQTGNFKKWGIEIRVSFRENCKAEVLSARVQSGGERSVSTIMYLMALQDMMVAPFRCVDEINQGLDDRNERLVFRRIVENSTRQPPKSNLTDHSGQYFLITPKLLPNLYDMEVEGLTVLFVFNGTFITLSATLNVHVVSGTQPHSQKHLPIRKYRSLQLPVAQGLERGPPGQLAEKAIYLT